MVHGRLHTLPAVSSPVTLNALSWPFSYAVGPSVVGWGGCGRWSRVKEWGVGWGGCHCRGCRGCWWDGCGCRGVREGVGWSSGVREMGQWWVGGHRG
jgi:hypothetical protein